MSSAYGGTPATVPGVIEAENFDVGGEGVAYHDTDVNNLYGQYRTSDRVDINTCTDQGGGYYVGSVFAGEWLNYMVNVTAAANYVFTFRAASGGMGGTFHVECDGVDKTGAISIPNTNGGSSWMTLSSPVFGLTAGQHVLRMVMDSNGQFGTVANFNWFNLRSPDSNSPYGGSVATVPATIQAEDFDLGGDNIGYHDADPTNTGTQYRPAEGVDIGTCTDDGGGYTVLSVNGGEWLKYTLSVPTTSSYALAARCSSAGAGGTYHVEIDGTAVTSAQSVPTTGSWNTWQTLMTPTFTVSSGQHVLRVVMDSNGATGFVANFNWFRLLDPATNTAYGGTARTIPGTIQAEDFDNGGQDIGYHDSDLRNFWNQYRTSDAVDINTTTDGSGYAVEATTAGEWLKYTVNVTTAGTYVIGSRVASVGGGTFHIEVDGVNKTGTLTVPNTSGWDLFQTVNKGGVVLSAGQHVVRVAIDSVGGSGTAGNFNYFTFTLSAANNPPTVSLTSPTAGALFTAGSNVAMSATAADGDGTISKVEFFAGATKIGEVASVPYNFTWTNPVAGTYSLTAKATDDLGGTTTSTAVSIVVNAPPTVALTAPATMASFTVGQPIGLAATAADSDGTVAKVEFFVAGTKLGEAASAPYSLSWTNVAAGTYSLTAKATDDHGAVTVSAPVTVTVTGPPSITIVATTPKVWEDGGVPGVFTVSRTGSLAGDLTLSYRVGGAAQPGVRYGTLSGSVTIPSGSASTTISVSPINDTVIEGDQAVVVTLLPDPSYVLGSPYTAGVMILDDETCKDF